MKWSRNSLKKKNKTFGECLTNRAFHPVRPPKCFSANLCYNPFTRVVCFCTGSCFNLFSCNSCLWFVACMKGFNMFIIICFKLQLCMDGYLGRGFHCCMELLHVFDQSKETQSKSTVVTTPWYFIWSVPL